jgi:glycine oxidase
MPEKEFDAVVAGAGVVGTSTAIRLTAAGMRVLLLDAAATPGLGSRAAAGIVVPSVRLLADPPMVDFARQGREVLTADVARLDVPVCTPGVLRPVPDQRTADQMARLAEPYPGFLGGWLDGAELAEREPDWRGRAHGAFHDPAAMVIDAAAYVDALVAEARATGVLVRTGVALRDVSTGPGRVMVSVDGGPVVADRVVLATGAWTGMLPFGPPVRPVRGQLIQVQGARRPRHILSGPLYTAPAPDGNNVLVGATEEDVGFAEGPTAAGLLLLLSEIARAWPALHSAKLTSSWSGFRAFSAGGRPYIGEVPGQPRILVATGHGGQGILTGGYTARLVRDLILGERPDLAAFALKAREVA